jgi:hypothetical protein
VTAAPLSGQVALIEDDHTLVINRGAEAGVVPGMVFTVFCGDGQVITDPESGRELGILRRDELQVRVFEVQPLFARAHTFVRTDDFHGLLQIPFVDQVVTVNVGDVVVQVSDQASSWAGTGTGGA